MQLRPEIIREITELLLADLQGQGMDPANLDIEELERALQQLLQRLDRTLLDNFQEKQNPGAGRPGVSASGSA